MAQAPFPMPCSEPEFEHYFGKRADKKRKLYNGMIKCDYYMFTENKRKK